MEPYASRIKNVLERRDEKGRFAPGVAAYSDSDMFKKSPSPDMPRAKRWDSHFTEECRNRRQCVLKQAAKHLKTPGLISLGGGLPSSTYFPFTSLSLTVPGPPEFDSASTTTTSIGKHDIPDGTSDYDLAVALNYGQVTGSAQLLRLVTELTEVLHDPPYADWWCTQTTGSTGALETAARMFLEKGRGDKVLMEEYTFSTAQETMEALGIGVVGVAMDGEGMVPAALRDVLEGWDEGAMGRKPHVLYTVPAGQNPTGASLGSERVREIYSICEKHDIFIIEDDPYYLLQMGPYDPSSHGGPSPASLPSFLSSLPTSFLSIDTSGRVLRLDSFSKVLAPGSRMGWVTGSAQVIERFLRHCESSQGPSGFSQAALYVLLEREWGHEGFLKWLARLGGEYTGRRDKLLRACDEFLPKEVAKWDVPNAGMFLWIKLDHRKHPRAPSILALEEEIFNSCIENGVLVARGSWFLAEAHSSEPTALFFRATYAAAEAGDMQEAMRRFGSVIRASFGI